MKWIKKKTVHDTKGEDIVEALMLLNARGLHPSKLAMTVSTDTPGYSIISLDFAVDEGEGGEVMKEISEALVSLKEKKA